MAFGLRSMVYGKKASMSVPKGYFAVYIGEEEQKKKRCIVPVSYLNEPAFQQLLSLAEEEFGYDHNMGGITIPCTQHLFLEITSQF